MSSVIRLDPLSFMTQLSESPKYCYQKLSLIVPHTSSRVNETRVGPPTADIRNRVVVIFIDQKRFLLNPIMITNA